MFIKERHKNLKTSESVAPLVVHKPLSPGLELNSVRNEGQA